MVIDEVMSRINLILREAYANPQIDNVFYSGMAKTGSSRLNALPCWDWRPERGKGVDTSGTIFFPLALGCAPRHTSEGKLWIEKLITTACEAESFSVPDISAGFSGEVLEKYRALRTAEPESFIILPDIQSPLGVVELLWDESFYTSMLEFPEVVHHVLNQTTDFIINFIVALHEIIGEKVMPCSWPGIWSIGAGTMVADDTMSLVSPKNHAEFSVPYLNRMAAKCGPLYYHSCTWRAPYFANIKAIDNVIAYNWNPGNSDDPALIMQEFAGLAVLAPHLVNNMHLDNDVLSLGKNFADEYEFFRYMLDSKPANSCLYFYFSDICGEGEKIERIYDLLDERGYTPQAQGIV